MDITPKPIKQSIRVDAGKVSIKKVETAQDQRRFIAFPYRLYKGNPCWIPPLRQGEAVQFDPARNPSFSTSRVRLWIAEKQGRVAGRIAGIINERERPYGVKPSAASAGWSLKTIWK